MDLAFNADELLANATNATGLDDFGPGSLRDGLEVLCGSLEADAQLSPLGYGALQGAMTAALTNRLKVVDWVNRHPEVTTAPIEAPVMVIGMFRAGTTLLSYLFDQDRSNRALLGWEAGDSVPPATPENHRVGPRVDAARAARAGMDQLNPKVRAIHYEEVDGATECISVMGQDFKSLSWEAVANVASYGTWLLDADHSSAYQYHRTVLQVLQSGGVTGQWTLKSPHHAIALEALTSVYPDAKLVMLHRDPIVLAASVCSLISTLSGTFTDADHTAYIADHWTTVLEASIRRTDRFRVEHPHHAIVDVPYANLVRDPVGTMESLYSSLGLNFDGRVAHAVRQYVAANPKGAKGQHRYDLESFGVNADELRERFAGYVDAYGIASEYAF